MEGGNPPANPTAAVMIMNKNKRLNLLLSPNETTQPPKYGSAPMWRAGLGQGRCGGCAGEELPRTSGSLSRCHGRGHVPGRPRPERAAVPQQAGGSPWVFNYTPCLCSLHFSAPFAARHTWNQRGCDILVAAYCAEHLKFKKQAP